MRFPEVRLQHISHLDKLISQSDISRRTWLKKLYERTYNNFDELIYFLNELEIVEIKNDKINQLEVYNDIADTILKQLVYKNAYNNIFSEFIESSRILKNEMILKPSDEVTFELSNLRDLLIDLQLIKFDYKIKRYELSPALIFIIRNIENGPESTLTKKKFDYLKTQKEKIGELAEEVVLDYEYRRLKSYPDLVDRIKHIANTDVGAGYDISSYIINKSIETIFIEVKAVSRIDYKFFWSRNELKKAKECPEQYYLYLVPVKNNGEIDISALEIVKNPYSNVYLDSNWKKRIEKYSFSKL